MSSFVVANSILSVNDRVTLDICGSSGEFNGYSDIYPIYETPHQTIPDSSISVFTDGEVTRGYQSVCLPRKFTDIPNHSVKILKKTIF